MTNIESEKVMVAAPIEECFTFLKDLNNYELLLPKDNISDWKSDETSCSFKIQKMYSLQLDYESSTEFNQIKLKSASGGPIAFELEVVLNDVNGNTEAQLLCAADINPFMKMMVMKPLNNLFNYMANRLVKVKGAVA